MGILLDQTVQYTVVPRPQCDKTRLDAFQEVLVLAQIRGSAGVCHVLCLLTLHVSTALLVCGLTLHASGSNL